MDCARLHFPTLSSTNDYFKEHWTDFGPFSFLTVDHQTAGRGRGDHEWHDNPGENLLCSLLIKDMDIVQKAPVLPLFAAYAVATFLERHGINGVQIKWPNDIYVSAQKIAGILVESRLPDFVIIGIGLNVNQTRFPSVKVLPTSMRLNTSCRYDVNRLGQELCDHLLCLLQRHENISIWRDYAASHDFLKGRHVRVDDSNGSIDGTVVGVDEEYALLLDTEKGIRPIRSGEVVWNE